MNVIAADTDDDAQQQWTTVRRWRVARFVAPGRDLTDDEADAIRIANDTPYGLTDYVQSTDGTKRNRMARALKAGMIEMNGESRGAGSPFGGVKLSGRAREGGVWGIEEYLESKAISAWSND